MRATNGQEVSTLWLRSVRGLDPRASPTTIPGIGIAELLQKLKEQLKNHGIASLSSYAMPEIVGFAYRPRNHEVFMALKRMRGVIFEEIPVQEDDADSAAAREAERRKQEMATMWESRRKNNRFEK